MTTAMYKWIVPAVGIVLGVLFALAEMGRHASLLQAGIAFAIVTAYWVALRLLQSRSDLANVLSGLPPDERWASINLRALSLAAQLLAVILVGAFLVTQFQGGDAMPYAWTGAAFAVAYIGGLFWYRIRS
jgi:hypothetical protein